MQFREIAPNKLEALLRAVLYHRRNAGGCPSWSLAHDIEAAEQIQQNIINSYELDFAKHAPVNEFQSFQAIWRSIPEQLAKENTKFIFSHVKKGWRGKDARTRWNG